MRRWTWFGLLLVLLATASAAADRSPVAVPLGPDVPRYTLNVANGTTTADCRLGNPNGPAYYISGWFTGGESYKYLFHPQLTNTCGCPAFIVSNIHMFMYFPDVCPLTVYVDLEDAVWDPQRNCWFPGAEDFTSPAYNITVPGPGLYDIGIPVTGSCAFMNYWYLISVHFFTVDCANVPDIVVDAGPITPCTNWNDWGFGWQDLVDYGFVWNLAMYADADCCLNPIPTENNTWGGVKSLYK
jgi:hypothetical protein